MMHLAALAAIEQALEQSPSWELAKGIALFVSTSGISYGVVLLRKIVASQQRHETILIGVDGKNGLRSKVDLLITRVDALEDRAIALDAVAEAERHLHPGPDRRIGARRMRDVTHEALDERARRHSDEHSTEDDDE